LCDSGDAIHRISEQRKIEPRRLSSILKGELDWIALKALEKDHERRYDGASYSTAVMVWSFLGQVLRDGKEAACQAGVARVVSSCLLLGEEQPTSDTGDGR
jgi:hypothetical protein